MPLAVANRKTMANPAINNYCDKDGRWFWIVGLEADRHWPPLARAVGHAEWTLDPRFATAKDRAINAAVLIALLDEIFATQSREEWAAIFDAEPELWWAPVQSLDEVIADPQVQAAGGWCEVPDGGGDDAPPRHSGRLSRHALAAALDGAGPRPAHRRGAPRARPHGPGARGAAREGCRGLTALPGNGSGTDIWFSL